MGAAQVGSVIRNPEVSVLVPTLLAAIADPGKHTRNTLEARHCCLCFALPAAATLLCLQLLHSQGGCQRVWS